MRKYYIDNLRTITVIVVVLFHVIYMFNNFQSAGVVGGFYEKQWWDHFQTLVYPWIMILLFLIAGMSARWSLEKRTAKEFARTRTDKLLIPVTLGLLTFQWITGYINASLLGDAGEQMTNIPLFFRYLIYCLSGTGVLWFLQMLWLFSMILLLVRKLEKDKFYCLCEKTPLWVFPLLGIPLWGAAQILNTPVIEVYRFGFYTLAFLIGYFLLSHDSVMDRLERFWLPLAILGTILAAADVYVYRWRDFAADHSVRDGFLTIFYAWIASLALLTGTKHFFNRCGGFMKYLNSKSWQLYIFHYTGIAATGYFLKNSGLPPVAVYLIAAIAGFGGAILLGEIIKRIPVLRFCVLGICSSKKAADYKKEESVHVS